MFLLVARFSVPHHDSADHVVSYARPLNLKVAQVTVALYASPGKHAIMPCRTLRYGEQGIYSSS